MIRLVCLPIAMAWVLVASSTASALPITIDTFDTDTMNWFVPGPSPNPPAHVATGGPAGAGDGYLSLTANGSNDAGGRLAALNATQWTGDFRAAGINAIEMDVFNFGPDDLTLRLLFEDFDGPGPPVNLALTLDDIFVPANSGWTKIVFDLSSSNLSALIGSVEGALSNVDVLRIFHNPDPAFPGPGIGIPIVTTVLGVDNIAAIPEPATGVLLLLGATAIVRRGRLRTKN